MTYISLTGLIFCTLITNLAVQKRFWRKLGEKMKQGVRKRRLENVTIFWLKVRQWIFKTTSMYSSTMHVPPACWPYPVVSEGVSALGVSAQRGVWPWVSAKGCVSQHAMGQTPPPLWTKSHTGVKTLPCPKLRLRAVNIEIADKYGRKQFHSV